MWVLPIMSLRPIHLLLAGLAAAGAARADTLYKCIEEGGTVLYTNQKGAGKNCTVMSRDLPVSTVPAPPHTVRSAPSDFPKVGAEEQKNRDNDRRKILEQELANEQQDLEKAKQALAEQEAIRTGDEKNYQRVLDRLKPFQDAVALHERNIEALNRELAKLK